MANPDDEVTLLVMSRIARYQTMHWDTRRSTRRNR